MIFVARLASLTETNRVFFPSEPVKLSLDLVERTPYAEVSSRHSFRPTCDSYNVEKHTLSFSVLSCI